MLPVGLELRSITASAAGCSGPKTATHTVTTNSTSVIKQLYLSDPLQALDRIDPVGTADATTVSTGNFSAGGMVTTSFTMNTPLCADLTIKAGIVSVKTYVTIIGGAMPATPNITAILQYGSTNIITLTNPSYAGGMLTWNANLASNVVVPAGQTITLIINMAQAGVTFNINYDSQTKPSRVELPVLDFININSMDIYTAAYPGGIPVASGIPGTTKYVRATVSDPFGVADINGVNVTITPGSTVAATLVNTSGCTRTYEYPWVLPATSGNYAVATTAKEGFENTVTNTRSTPLPFAQLVHLLL